MQQELKKVVQSSFLFEGMPPEKTERVISLYGECIDFSGGSVIYDREHYKKSIGIVLKGHAVVKNTQSVDLNVIAPGGAFGVASLFCEAQQYVTTIVAKGQCKVIFFSGDSLEKMMMEDFRIAKRYIAFLSRRINFLNRKIDSFTAPGVAEKLCLYLSDLIYQTPDGWQAKLTVSSAQLSRMLNIGRASLYRAFDALEEEGVLEKQNKTVRILNYEALLSYAQIH